MTAQDAGAPPESLRHKLFATDPYDGFPLSDWPEDRQGWGSTHRLFGLLIRVLRPKLIVEVGTWKGGSAIHMAEEAENAGVDVDILCIDTWLGSPGIYLRRDYTYRSLKHHFGYPQLYYTFLANVIHAGMQDVITPLPQTSDNAAEILRGLEIRPELVYIDAAHDYAPVKKDLANYFDLMAPDGVLIGDDYSQRSWPGVVQAVHEFVEENPGVNLYVDHGKYAVSRRDLATELGPVPR